MSDVRIPTNKLDLRLVSRVYAKFLGQLELSVEDFSRLEARGLNGDQISAGSFKTLTYGTVADGLAALIPEFDRETLLSVPGVIDDDGTLVTTCTEGLLIPVFSAQGFVRALHVRNPNDDGPKYRWISGGPGGSIGSPVHFPINSQPAQWRDLDQAGKAVARDWVQVVEGPLKAHIVACLSGVPTLGLPGVSAWKSLTYVLEKDPPVGVYLAIDQDWLENQQVRRCRREMIRAMGDMGLRVKTVDWNPDYKGLDDFLAANPEEVPQLAEIDPAKI